MKALTICDVRAVEVLVACLACVLPLVLTGAAMLTGSRDSHKEASLISQLVPITFILNLTASSYEFKKYTHFGKQKCKSDCHLYILLDPYFI